MPHMYSSWILFTLLVLDFYTVPIDGKVAEYLVVMGGVRLPKEDR